MTWMPDGPRVHAEQGKSGGVDVDVTDTECVDRQLGAGGGAYFGSDSSPWELRSFLRPTGVVVFATIGSSRYSGGIGVPGYVPPHLADRESARRRFPLRCRAARGFDWLLGR
jgi:hypothetical protein